MEKKQMGQKKEKKVETILAMFPIIMTILEPYALTEGGGVFICDILVIALAAYLIISRKILLYKPLFIILIVDFILTIVSFAFTSSNQTSIILALKIGVVFVLYLTVYSSIWSYDIREKFFLYAEIIGLGCAILAILQFIFSSMGIAFFDGKLFFPVGEGNYFGGLFDLNTNDLRVHSFFEEPSYLAIFELPVTIYLIQNKKYMKAIVCAISCVLSGSLIGIVGLVGAVIALLFLDSEITYKQKMIFGGVLVVALVILVYIYNSNNSVRILIDYYTRRMMNVQSSVKRDNSSFSQRIIGNSALFNEYNIFNKLVGVGFNQYSLYFGIFKDYSNDFVSNLLNFGYVGIVVMILEIIRIIKRVTPHGRILAMFFVMVLAVDHSWFGVMFFYLITWIIASSDIYTKKSIFVKVRY